MPTRLTDAAARGRPPPPVRAGRPGRQGARLGRGPRPTLAVGLLLALGACGSRIEPGGSCPPALAPPTYTATVKPFLDSHCAGCHSSTAISRAGAPAGINYDTYEAAKDNSTMGTQDMVSGRMPPGSALTGGDACVLNNWIAGGFLL